MSALSDHELQMVAFAAEASGPKSDEALERIIAWAERVSVDAALFELVVGGSLMLDWDPIEQQVRFKLTQAACRGQDDA